MVHDYTPIQQVPLQGGTTFLRPLHHLPERVKLSDPALSVMTDLSKVSVVGVRSRSSLDRANFKMIRYGVRMLLVMDDSDHIAGLLTLSDLLGEKPMRVLQHMGGTHSELMVRDVMSTQRELEVMLLADVKQAQVGNVVATLKRAHRQHGMVVTEEPDGVQALCGIFSVTQIARQLGAKVHDFELASTFKEIESVIEAGKQGH